jgi:hypothetical protein
LQALWRNPFAVSALASLGAHGLFFLALPFLPYTTTKAKEPEIKRSVGVVQLTPEEQKRLPDFATASPIQLPPLARPPKSDNDLFSLNPPKLPASSSLPPVDALPSLPPLPIFIPQAPPEPVPLPPLTVQIPAAPRPRPARPAPSATPAPAPTVTPSTAAESPSPQVAVEPGPQSPQANNSETSQNQAANPSPEQQAAQPSPTVRTEAQIRQDLLARQAELRQLYTFNSAGTSVKEGNFAFLGWYREIFGKDYGEGETKPKQEEIVSDYPRTACPLKQSRSAVIGAVIDTNNKLVGDPKVLQSSGYPLFNNAALKAVKSYVFNNSTGNQQPYLIRVQFNYSEKNCPAGLPARNVAPPS